MNLLGLHAAEGLWLGSLLGGVTVAHRWTMRRPLAGAFAITALVSVVLGAWSALTANARIHTAWWIDTLLQQPGMSRLEHHAAVLGDLLVLAWLIGFYVLVLIGAARATAKPAARR